MNMCPTFAVPRSEYNAYLPADSAESRKLKAQEEGPEALEKLTLKDKHGNEIEKQLPGGKVKKKQKPQVGHKCVRFNVLHSKPQLLDERASFGSLPTQVLHVINKAHSPALLAAA